MAGRALLVCALCALCCAAGGGWAAEGEGYCTERDWRDLRAVAKDMSEAEIAAKYCGRKPEFVRGLRASLQGDGAEEGAVSGHGGVGGGVEGAAGGGLAQPAGAKEEGEENNPQADTHGAEVSREETTGPSGEHGGLGGSPSRENEPSPSGEAEGHSASGASTGVKAAEVQLGASLGGPSDAETSLGEGQTENSLQGPPHAAPSTGLDGQRTVQEEQHKTDLSTPEEVPLKGADVSTTQGDEHTQNLRNTSDVNAQETTEIVPSQNSNVAA
ncbi:uncharacterized protein Tco025E_08822, partial [Trypanosoma conorhini]